MTITPSPRGEHSRNAILLAAHDLFVSQGYHGTSMRQIAQRSNLALGGLYNHFSSKELVFEAVFQAYHPYHEVFPLLAGAQGESLEQRVQDAVRRMVQAVTGRPDFMNLMFIEMVEFNSVHVRQLFGSLYPRGLDVLQQLVGSHTDQIRSIPAPILVRTFLGLIFGYYITEAAISAAAPPEFQQDAMQYFADIYLHGILAHKENIESDSRK